MPFIWILLYSIVTSYSLFDKPTDKTLFISPLKIPNILSSNFGDLRVDHFHSGLDIKTQGVEEQEVVASADG